MMRERAEYNIVIVGGGVAGLSAAIRFKQLASQQNKDFSVVVLEKGADIGSHILSGAVIDPVALFELFPNALAENAPLHAPVTQDDFYLLGAGGDIRIPHFLLPPFMHNKGNYAVSLGDICVWLSHKAESLGVEIYTGMAVSELLYNNNKSVIGVVAGVFGIAKDGTHKSDYQAGMELYGDYIFLAEGVRGSLSQKVIKEYHLDTDSEPQKYGIGFKELWEISPDKHHLGKVVHTMGWPLSHKAGGGGFMYHLKDNFVSIGAVIHLNYENPYLSPFDEFQQMKTHPLYAETLMGGRRISYGARAINEGGLQSIPKLVFKGGALIGCSAGFVNVPRIKGSHNAMKTGMLAAESAFKAIMQGRKNDILEDYPESFKESFVYRELKMVRNVKPLWSKFGLLGGIILGGLDMWVNYFSRGVLSLFGTLKHYKADNESLKKAEDCVKLSYPKPDGVLTFDRLTSVSFSGTNHNEDEPCHLHLKDKAIPIAYNLPLYAEPAQRYCPAGVYEVLYETDGTHPRFQINAQNCVHCKTCDIKDPAQNIIWKTPEGGGGPNYSGM